MPLASYLHGNENKNSGWVNGHEKVRKIEGDLRVSINIGLNEV